MTAYSIHATDSDKVYTWADIGGTSHPIDPLMDWALTAWKRSFEMADLTSPDWAAIEKLQNTAMELERYSRNETECTCTPDFDCPVCAAIARVMNNEMPY